MFPLDADDNGVHIPITGNVPDSDPGFSSQGAIIAALTRFSVLMRSTTDAVAAVEAEAAMSEALGLRTGRAHCGVTGAQLQLSTAVGGGGREPRALNARGRGGR